MRKGRRAEAQAMWLAAQKSLESLAAEQPVELGIKDLLAQVYGNQATFLFLTSAPWEETAQAFQRIVDIEQQLLEEFPQNSDYRNTLARAQ